MGYPAQVPTIDFYAGDDYSQEYDLTQSGSPYSLTGWTSWAAQWRAIPLSPIALTLGVDTSLLASGILTVTFPAATVRAMGIAGVWDIQATRISDGWVRTWLRGKTTWQLDVTRV